MLLLLLVPGLLHAQIPAKTVTVNRAINIGVKAIDRDEINKTVTCLQDPIFRQSELLALGTAAVGCVTDAAGMAKLAGLALVLPGLETCLLLQFTSSIIITAKVTNVLLPEIETIYNVMLSKFDVMKRNSKTKDQILNQGFSIINSRINRTYINQLCLKIAKTMTKKQFKCLMEKGRPVFDLTDYGCAAYVKSDLLG